MALNGKANFSRMTYGKSNDKVEPLGEGYREVQKKAGFEFLKTFCGDGGPDREVWKKIFKKLTTGVNPYIPTHLDEDICYFRSKVKVRDWALSIAEKIQS